MAEGAERKESKQGAEGSEPVSTATATSEAKNDAADLEGEPAWPPREAAPRDAAPDKPDRPSSAAAPVMMPPTEADAQGGAALPGQEMPFSDSTLHWLEDGEATGTTRRPTSPTGSLPSYDPRAPVVGRKRAVVVVGGAGALALIVAGTLFVQARSQPPPKAPVAVAEPARDFTARAEAAFAANQISEAIDLAHLALSADQRHADAHFVMANCERARNQVSAARVEYRKYLDLAPLGLHAAAARDALDAMPQ